MQKWKRNYESWKKSARHWLNPKNPQKFFGKKPSLEYYANRHHSQHRSRSPQTDWSPWDQVTMQPWRQKTTPWCHNPWFKRLNTKTKNSPLPFQDLMWCATTWLKSTGNREDALEFQVSPRATFLTSLCKCCKPFSEGATKHQRSSKPARQSVHCHMSNWENYGIFKHQLLIWALPELSLLPFHCPTGTLVSSKAGLGAEKTRFPHSRSSMSRL